MLCNLSKITEHFHSTGAAAGTQGWGDPCSLPQLGAKEAYRVPAPDLKEECRLDVECMDKQNPRQTTAGEEC